MNYASIKQVDVANGIGVRVSLFVSGCRHECPNCFNYEAWDFNYGEVFDDSTIDELITLLSKEYIHGLSLLGGEPLEKENQEALLQLVKRVRLELPDKTIWCYSGFIYEEILKMMEESPIAKELISNIDVLVDGRYIEQYKVVDLKFRGSSNQRIIDVKQSLHEKKVVLKEEVY